VSTQDAATRGIFNDSARSDLWLSRGPACRRYSAGRSGSSRYSARTTRSARPCCRGLR